jgi:hypothetical protein
MHRCGLLIILAVIVQSAGAQTPEPTALPVMSLEEAHALRVRAEAMKSEAQERYANEQNACYKKFLVNDCLESAKTRQMESMLKARELDQTGREVERAAHRRAVEAKEAAHAAELSPREAEQQAQAERYRSAEAGKAAERERKLADKARQAEEGRRRTAAEQGARRQKLEQRAKEDAERAAKKAAEAGASTPR